MFPPWRLIARSCQIARHWIISSTYISWPIHIPLARTVEKSDSRLWNDRLKSLTSFNSAEFGEIIQFARITRPICRQIYRVIYSVKKKKIHRNNSNRVKQTRSQGCVWRINYLNCFSKILVFFLSLVCVEQTQSVVQWGEHKADATSSYRSYLSSDLFNLLLEVELLVLCS